jgi:UDP-N-acetylglucosamine 2-epimerase (non-hydrolysing)
MQRVLTVVGARPNFMKAAPIHRAFRSAGWEHDIVHTGQHYDAAMSKVFFEDLGMPEPVEFLGVGSGSHATQTAACMVGLERVFEARQPDMVLVVGDVNSTVAGALVAAKLGIPVGHVEAGLRSRDWAMPEEVNRAVVDVLADLLLTPSADADANLRAEGRNPERIVMVGNVMIDSLLHHLERARTLEPFAQLGIDRPDAYAVLTLHRPSNVDDLDVLADILAAVESIAGELPVVFPVHPRTLKQIERLPRRTFEGIHQVEPLGYLEFMALYSSARLVLTDSGGIQEETTALGIPCLTLRHNTERPVTVEEGTNVVVGNDPARIVEAANDVLRTGGKQGRVPRHWDGKASDRIVAAVKAQLDADPHRPR